MNLWWVLLSTLLMGCASATSTVREDLEEEVEVTSWEAACQEARSLSFLCDEEGCAFYQCRDTLPGQIVQTRGGPTFSSPAAPGGGRRPGDRRWLRPQGRPVFAIPWRFHDRRPRQHPTPLLLTSGRWVRHHIFPQAHDLASWFKQQGVDIHAYTMLLPHHLHVRIHSGAPRGGLWNEAWRNFKYENPDASAVEIWIHAGRLLHSFDINGPVVPYR